MAASNEMSDSALLQWTMLSSHLSQMSTNEPIAQFRLNEPGPAAMSNSILQEKHVNVLSEGDDSFEVLGKSSLSSSPIERENELEPPQHPLTPSQTLDPKSLLSFMNAEEITQKLSDVIQENSMLKEALEKNNQDLEQQYDKNCKISVWQKEVLEVSNSQKQKFSEVKKLLGKLKMENEDLKKDLKMKESLVSSQASSASESAMEQSSNSNEEFARKIETLFEDVQVSKSSFLNTQKELSEIKTNHAQEITTYKEQLAKVNDELQLIRESVQRQTGIVEPPKVCEKCVKNQGEIDQLKNIIVSLKQQVEQFETQPLSTVSLSNSCYTEEMETFNGAVGIYNEKMMELNKIFSLQSLNALCKEEIMGKCILVIEEFVNKNNDPEAAKEAREKLSEYRKKIIDQTLQTYNDKQAIIKIQQDFHKILSDYKSAISEMEIIKNENSKLLTLQNKLVQESSEKMAEMQKSVEEDKKSLDSDMAHLLDERIKLHQEKKQTEDLQKQLAMERSVLHQERLRFVEERANVSQERISLDLQGNLFEAKKASLLEERKNWQKKFNDMQIQIRLLQEELLNANDKSEVLYHENADLREKVKLFPVYEIQKQILEKDFEELSNQRDLLQDQVNRLAMSNAELRDKNYRLQGDE